jgi:mono/diheme cytochrome c family protein
MNARLLTILLLVLVLPGCDEMEQQPRYDSYEESALFSDGKSMQAPPEGTLAQDDPASIAALAQRPPMSPALLARGQERFGIYCAVCHDAAGYGRGTVPARGFPQPPSFHIPRLRQASSAYFVEVITHGHGVMYSYADRVRPADRWAIAAYIRALQQSQDTDIALLSPAQRAGLAENAGGD